MTPTQRRAVRAQRKDRHVCAPARNLWLDLVRVTSVAAGLRVAGQQSLLLLRDSSAPVGMCHRGFFFGG